MHCGSVCVCICVFYSSYYALTCTVHVHVQCSCIVDVGSRANSYSNASCIQYMDSAFCLVDIHVS